MGDRTLMNLQTEVLYSSIGPDPKLVEALCNLMVTLLANDQYELPHAKTSSVKIVIQQMVYWLSAYQAEEPEEYDDDYYDMINWYPICDHRSVANERPYASKD